MSRFLALLLILVACEPPPPPVPGELDRSGAVLKVVNGQNVTQGMVDARLAQLPPSARDQVLAKGQMPQVEEELVVGEILYQEALKQKLHERPETKLSLALSARNALANAVLEDAIKARSTDEAIKTWYNDHLDQFKRPQLKGRLILVKDEAEGKSIAIDLKGGADFATVATAKSIHKASAKEGGSLGWFETARMGPELSAALADAKSGDLVGPIVTAKGVHIIQVEERRDAVPIEEVSDKIKAQLRQEVAEAYVEELKKAGTMADPGATTDATVAPAASTGEALPGDIERTGAVLKVVNGKNVTQGMVDARLAQLPADIRDQVLAKGQLAQVQEELVVGELLYQEAVKQKLHERPEVKTSIALSARNALANSLLEDAIKARTTDDAVTTWYNDHLVQFKRAQLKGRLILVKDNAEAKAILAEIKGGADFGAVATAKSLHKASAKDGGDLGWFETARMGPEVSAALATAKPGDVVGPIAGAGGAQLIKIEEQRDAVPIAEVSDKIKSQLRQEIAEAYVEELKKAVTITTPGATTGQGGATVAPAAVQTEGTGAAPTAPAK